MTYESAPATRMLEVKCNVCARPLVDAASVEAGIGPVCRSRLLSVKVAGAADWPAAMLLAWGRPVRNVIGTSALVDAMNARDAHRAANVVVTWWARRRHKRSWPEALLLIDALGYDKLAERLAQISHMAEEVARERAALKTTRATGVRA